MCSRSTCILTECQDPDTLNLKPEKCPHFTSYNIFSFRTAHNTHSVTVLQRDAVQQWLLTPQKTLSSHYKTSTVFQ